MTTQLTTEQGALELIAMDRIDIPLSSLHLKLQRDKKSQAVVLARGLTEDKGYDGERASLSFVKENKQKARGMKEAVAAFAEKYPKHGAVLYSMIEEKRMMTEEHLYFEMNPGCRLTSDDYIGVMRSIGLTEASARGLYPALMDLSRNLERKRVESRSIIVGSYNKTD